MDADAPRDVLSIQIAAIDCDFTCVKGGAKINENTMNKHHDKTNGNPLNLANRYSTLSSSPENAA